VAAVARQVGQPRALDRALGEWLSEPKPSVSFDGGAPLRDAGAVVLDRRTRMLYDDHHVYINGESFHASGADASLMRRLADARALDARYWRRASDDARRQLDEWARAGWLHAAGSDTEGA
jgi:50S ribosomal protein L16 3-hydroxylase